MILDVSDDPAVRAALHIARRIRGSRSGRPFHLGVSGGQTPDPMFRALARAELDWRRVHVWQVDERIERDDDPARNLTGLRAALDVPVVLHPMPIHDADAPVRYAADLRRECGGVLDLVHLGLGEDGHFASLIPGDAALDATGVDVAWTGPYRGRRRLTLTFAALERAAEGVWLVTGAAKHDALRRLLAHDPAVPAGRLRLPNATLFADGAAARGRG